MGSTYEYKVVKINQERQNIVLSRRELIEQERSEKRAKLLAEMTPGDIRKGTVKNITDFGAFIDLNGLDGLLHITDMSWGRINHPSELLTIGQEIDVVVLDINYEKERVSLGLKQKLANPGTILKPSIQSVPRSRDASSIWCLTVPLSNWNLAWKDWCMSPNSPGPNVSPNHRTSFLKIKPSKPSFWGSTVMNKKSPWAFASWKPTHGTKPWINILQGTKVCGKIRNLTSYGAFIELEEGLDGMIHVSDISWTRKINHPSEVLKKGDEVEAVVIEIDKPISASQSVSNN